MKLLFVLLALPFMASKCNKKNENTEKDGYLHGKVIRVSCASFIVQVTNDDTVGEDGWKDMSNNDKQYDNVFAVGNSCKLPAGIGAGATIKFKADKPVTNDCVHCMMFDGPPAAKFDLSDVSIVGK